MQLRVRRSSPGRDQISPHAYRVMRSWKSSVNGVVRSIGPVDVRVAEHRPAHLHPASVDVVAALAHVPSSSDS